MRLKVNNKLWVISDTHFGHRNIIRYGERPESHEAIMLSNWIERVRDPPALELDRGCRVGLAFTRTRTAPRTAKSLGPLKPPGRRRLVLSTAYRNGGMLKPH